MQHYRSLFIFVLICALFSSNLEGNEVRAAIDFGSGAIKIQAAVIDEKSHTIVGQPLVAKTFALSLTEDAAAHDGYISDEMVQKALSYLQRVKEEALAASAREGISSIEFAGIATAVFRKAKNGQDVLNLFEEQLGIHFQILSQDVEGQLGFLTAKVLFPNTAENKLLAWDSGNGSFQMSIREGNECTVYQGPLGQGTVRVLLSRDIRHGPILTNEQSGLPISNEEAEELSQYIKAMLPPTPAWLQTSLNSDSVVVATFGDGESIFALTAQAVETFKGNSMRVDEAEITSTDVQKVIDAFIGKEDEALISLGLHDKTLTSAIHLLTLMEHFGIEKIHFKRSMGSTPGMLLTPELWHTSYKMKMQRSPHPQ